MIWACYGPFEDEEQDELQKDAVNCEKGSTADEIAQEILKYKSLLDQGLLTKEEFDAKKKEILNL